MTISRSDAAHLLRRSGFGALPAEIDRLAESTNWEAAVDTVLDTTEAPPAMVPPSSTEPLESWQHRVELVRFWIERMRTTPCPIVEKMALFFHGHQFPSSWNKRDDQFLAWNQIELFREYALGDYHELTQRVAVDPWMLHYLDNGGNVAPDRINENFGRELLELFTLGRGEFTEDDVRAMSRAWTGHNLADDGKTYVFVAAAHDDGDKTLFGITRNWDGPAAISEVLKGSKAVPASRFFVGKLWTFLVGTAPTPEVVNALSSAFRASGLSLRTLVRGIFLRPEFRSAAARSGRVLSPVEWFVALTKILGFSGSVSQPTWWITPMGHDLFRPPNVAGWPVGEHWLSVSGWWRRGECARWLCHQAVKPDRPDPWMPEMTSNTPPNVVADELFAAFAILDPSPATRMVVESWAESLGGSWAGPSIRYHSIPLIALSPDFNLG